MLLIAVRKTQSFSDSYLLTIARDSSLFILLHPVLLTTPYVPCSDHNAKSFIHNKKVIHTYLDLLALLHWKHSVPIETYSPKSQTWQKGIFTKVNNLYHLKKHQKMINLDKSRLFGALNFLGLHHLTSGIT